jgi:hypothetical protein
MICSGVPAMGFVLVAGRLANGGVAPDGTYETYGTHVSVSHRSH